MRILLLFFLLLSATLAHAIQEREFVPSMRTRVIPFIKENLRRGSFRSFDGTRINYGLLRNPQNRATVVICPGRTESIIGLTEMIYDLAHMGYSVAVLDHRGQGESQRLVPHSTVGHVGSFYDYVDDFKIFNSEIVTQQMPGPYLLVASSMGGAIGSLFMIENPTMFTAAVLGAPMIHIDMNPFPLSVVDTVAAGFEYFEDPAHFAPTRGEYDFTQKFEGNVFTHSRTRLYFDVAMTKKNPQIATGGPSLGWVREALKAGNRLVAEADRLRTPTLIFQAGLDDVVENSAQTDFCRRAKMCKLKSFANADHWIFMESDSTRNRLFLDLDAFFESKLEGPSPGPRL